MNDHNLNEYAKQCARDIVAGYDIQSYETLADYEQDFNDSANDWADTSQHVIYYSKAHAVCQNCNVDAGEEFLEDVGNPDPCTYDSLACAIAYGELRARIMKALNDILSEDE
jgi:hypothetical protein